MLPMPVSNAPAVALPTPHPQLVAFSITEHKGFIVL